MQRYRSEIFLNSGKCVQKRNKACLGNKASDDLWNKFSIVYKIAFKNTTSKIKNNNQFTHYANHVGEAPQISRSVSKLPCAKQLV